MWENRKESTQLDIVTGLYFIKITINVIEIIFRVTLN